MEYEPSVLSSIGMDLGWTPEAEDDGDEGSWWPSYW